MANKQKPSPPPPLVKSRIRRWFWRLCLCVVLIPPLLIGAYTVVPVYWTPYQVLEAQRLGGVEKKWVSLERVSPVMARAAVAAEDANYCTHWGFDMAALRAAVDGGARRGGSTISQQTVKNVLLWQGRSWPRKAIEAVLTPMAELVWSKRRLLEIYLNVIEFDEGVFGVQAASRHYFGVDAADLSSTQAARLAAILPSPKDRSASRPSDFVVRRAAQIRDGAATIQKDGRADCFQEASS